MGHSKALKLKSAVTGAYCQMMYTHSGRRKPSLFARGSEGATVCFEFNTRRSRPRPSPDRGREVGGVGDSGFWVCSTEAVRNRFIAAVCASRGRPGEALSRLSHPRLPGRRPFPSCGVEVLGSANCHVNHRGIMRARRSPLSVLPLQKSDGEGALNFTGHAAGRLVRVRVRRRASLTPSFLPSLLSSSTSLDGNGDLKISQCRAAAEK